jgi:hypothetical protein
LFQRIDSQNFCSFFFDTQIGIRFLHILKTMTFTRILVSNLFGESNLFSRKMKKLLLKNLLSNFVTLFEFMLKDY